MSVQQLPISPDITAETAAFWEAANEGRLLLRRCTGTDTVFHPPRTISPFTGLVETEWSQVSGDGIIYSFSVTKRHGTEHCIVYVQLAEGPIILSALVDCDFETVEIGQAVSVVFKTSVNGQLIPMFTPSASGAD